MKLVTFAVDSCRRVGALMGDAIVDLREARGLQLLSMGATMEEAHERACSEVPDSMVRFIEGGERTLSVARECEEFAMRNRDLDSSVLSMKDVKVLTPIPEPLMILNMGNAYRPMPLGGFTFKPVTGLIGPDEPILIPKEISDFGACYEVEIGIVIGTRGRRIPCDRTAYDFVYGYTVYNDVTDYGKQIVGKFDSKLHDTFCPVGPCLVTKDEIEDPYNLVKKAWINGQLATERSTCEMLHTIPEFVSIPSQTLTLLPGTIVSTGAPDAGRIGPGDVVELEITNIGKMRNPVIAER